MKKHNYLRPLSALVPGLTQGIFGRKNMLFGKMAAEWTQVAGEEIASKTAPIDLKFASPRKSKSKKDAKVDKNVRPIPTVSDMGRDKQPGQAVLHLAVQPGFALEFSYQKSLLIERLNMFFGYPAIKDIQVTQSYALIDAAPAARRRPPALNAGEAGKIDALVGEVQENDLQTALRNLGKSLASRAKEGTRIT